MSELRTYPTSIKAAVEEYYTEHPAAALPEAAAALGLTRNQVRIARHALTRNGIIPALSSVPRKPDSQVGRVEAFYLKNPWASHEDAAKALGLTEQQVRKSRFRRAVVRERVTAP